MKLAVDGALEELSPEERRGLLHRTPEDEPRLRERVREILERVRSQGDEALFELARELDGVELDALEVPRARWEEALAGLDPTVREALERSRTNIRRFHEAQLPEPLEIEVEPGVRLGRLATPLPGVGVYAPGGRASYPSSVLMGAVPAVAAGVGEIVVCSPPGPGGEPPPAVMAACALAGATRLFSLGGAGAVAAMAYGTGSVPAVSAIVGPGNRWVTEGKRQVAGDVRTDAPAGPSEVLIVAEGSSSSLAELVAREMVAQSEHDTDAAAVLVTPSRALLDRVRSALEERVATTPRRETVRKALARNGALLLSADLEEALEFARAYAPEHLALYTADPREDMTSVRTAGTIFLGPSTSVTLGDYVTGANHVLPTGGRGRSFSGLSVLDYLRFFTYQEADPEAAAELAESVASLARAEGLPGHADAALARARPDSGREGP